MYEQTCIVKKFNEILHRDLAILNYCCFTGEIKLLFFLCVCLLKRKTVTIHILLYK